jgi:hypothetical protein
MTTNDIFWTNLDNIYTEALLVLKEDSTIDEKNLIISKLKKVIKTISNQPNKKFTTLAFQNLLNKIEDNFDNDFWTEIEDYYDEISIKLKQNLSINDKKIIYLKLKELILVINNKKIGNSDSKYAIIILEELISNIKSSYFDQIELLISELNNNISIDNKKQIYIKLEELILAIDLAESEKKLLTSNIQTKLNNGLKLTELLTISLYDKIIGNTDLKIFAKSMITQWNEIILEIKDDNKEEMEVAFQKLKEFISNINCNNFESVNEKNLVLKYFQECEESVGAMINITNIK